MPFRILHTADLHLDVPIGGAGPTPPALTRQLATAGLDTLDRLVDLALAEDVDAVLVAGGLWTGGHPDEVAGRRAAGALDAPRRGIGHDGPRPPPGRTPRSPARAGAAPRFGST